MELINASGLTYSYGGTHRALDGVSLRIDSGEFVAVLGISGSGKTTLARLLNVLLPVQGGELHIAGNDARDENRLWQIRKSCGMVFQDADDQFAFSYVEENVAFGARNFGAEEEKIPALVRAALSAVGMSGFERRSPLLLSAGERQRIALAGVVAAQPDAVLLDCACDMLDARERQQLLTAVKRLNDDGVTVVMFTRRAEEAAIAGRIVLLHSGRVTADGAARDVLSDAALMREAGLEPPFPVLVYYDLLNAGIRLDSCPLTVEELAGEVCR